MVKDFSSDFQTPSEVCKYMVSLLPAGVKTVLEPTPGRGNIVRELSKYEVTAPKDFFLLPQGGYDAVIMNPPFSHKFAIMDNAPLHFNKAGMRMGYLMLTECLKRADIVIALMPWFTISDSDIRLRNLKTWGIKSVTVLPRKTFQYARIQTVILEMRKGWVEETQFKVYDLLNSNQLQKLF